MRLQKILQRLSRSAAKTTAPEALLVAGASGDTSPRERRAMRHASLDRLALQTAIIHHLEWCVLFNEHLSVDARHSQQLVPLPSAMDSGLGQWLDNVRQGPAGDEPRLGPLAAEHEKFHLLAQQALRLARMGRMDLASTLLNTDFERSRARVLDLLRQMQKS